MSTHVHTSDNGIGSITPSDAHDLLSNTRRRETLRIVVQHGTIDKSALIDRVAEREYGRSVAEIDHRERKRIQVSLAQAHLPKLAAADAVVSAEGTVTTGAAASNVLEYDHDTRSGGLVGRLAEALR